MPNRLKFESRFADVRMADVKASIKTDGKKLAQKVRQLSTLARPVVFSELKSVLRQPRLFGSVLEENSPWLNRRFLSVASIVTEPFTVGMGLKIESLSDEMVEVTLPGWWRNQGEKGTIHSGALATLGEFTARLFWERHLDLRRSEVQSQRIELRRLSPSEGAMRAVYRLASAEREAILYRLRAQGQIRSTSLTMIYNRGGLLIAEVEVDWRLEKQAALAGGRLGTTESAKK